MLCIVKQPDEDCILRDDFLPYIKALLNDHPVSFGVKSFIVVLGDLKVFSHYNRLI